MGIYLSEKEDGVDLRDYIIDSVLFINLIVSIEEKLEIEFPDELFLYENLTSLTSYSIMLDDMLKEKASL